MPLARSTIANIARFVVSPDTQLSISPMSQNREISTVNDCFVQMFWYIAALSLLSHSSLFRLKLLGELESILEIHSS